ncbi:MAG TPA: GNAT family N-acetyltransferase [Usitatibacter sp.]|nr:GNAT family N-acetyltransferase [Usitatibacter sp.]
MGYRIRPARDEELEAAERMAAEAFAGYAASHREWVEALVATRPMHEIAAGGEVLVAVDDANRAVAAVGYVGPGKPRRDFFPADWAILRMLSVPPCHRGHGIARQLVDAVIARALRDRVTTLGLYSSPVMAVAVGLYQRMGFVHQRALPVEHGLPDDLYALDLSAHAMR